MSNFFSNYFNLMLNRSEQFRLLNQLLVKDLTDLHVYGQSQSDLFDFTGDMERISSNLEDQAQRRFRFENSMAAGIREDGSYLFSAGTASDTERFPDEEALERMREQYADGDQEGTVDFVFDDKNYLAVYKWHEDWDAFFVRGEQESEFYASSREIFSLVSIIIMAITALCAILGIFVLRYILRFVPAITNAIMRMQHEQRIDLVDMSGAPNDDVTYLGTAFNSLSSTIDNLMNIFKKFVARDVAHKAYREREIRLEGEKRDLTILFTDIRSFTFMTETLGTDIIRLLNLHYDEAIRHIHAQNGDIASIIGDALLAIFGAMDDEAENKSYHAVRSAYLIQDVAKSLRERMTERRDEILRTRGALTEAEERVYRAVLVQVGVGIDGGEVFYGNIGSEQRMVNTVIGDNVNSSSRLEGLTRFYNTPVITSSYVKEEVEKEYADYRFVELDTVTVKGKTGGSRIYWPVERDKIDDDFERDLNNFSEGLQLYYDGKWPQAYEAFSACSLPVSEVFIARTKDSTAPTDWDGIWKMTEK
ncbi:MAG: adenylate/guanylate cyclase domain-containing protein [Spirochaetia bacterium]